MDSNEWVVWFHMMKAELPSETANALKLTDGGKRQRISTALTSR
jgi:hypothetical protein